MHGVSGMALTRTKLTFNHTSSPLFNTCSDALPLSAASAHDHQYLFGCAYFRQQRDPKVRRGFLQRSLVAISETPHVTLLKQAVRILGAQYFDSDGAPSERHADSLLETAFAEISRWPGALPGTQLELPLCGVVLHFEVPWTSFASYRLQGAGASGRGALSQPQLALDATDSLMAAHSIQTHSHAVTLSDVFTVRNTAPTGPVDPPGSNSATPSTPIRGAGVPHGHQSESQSQSQQINAGMFTDVGLFTAFRGLVPSLWHLWELAITGQPVLVMGANPAACGDAVLGLVSLVAPLEFCADFRPYFTLYDPDFHQVTALVDAQWGRTNTRLPKLPGTQGLGQTAGGAKPSKEEAAAQSRALAAQPTPPLLIGTTNPFFTKALERWPNAIWLGQGGGVGGSGSGALGHGAGGSTNSLHGRALSAGPSSGRASRASYRAMSITGRVPTSPAFAAGRASSSASSSASLAADGGSVAAGCSAPGSPTPTPRICMDVFSTPPASSRGQPGDAPSYSQLQAITIPPPALQSIGDGHGAVDADKPVDNGAGTGLTPVSAKSKPLLASLPGARAFSAPSSGKDEPVDDGEGLPSANETPGINMKRESAAALVALTSARSTTNSSASGAETARRAVAASATPLAAVTGSAHARQNSHFDATRDTRANSSALGSASPSAQPPATPLLARASSFAGAAPSSPAANFTRPLRGYSTAEVRYRIIAATTPLGDALPGLGLSTALPPVDDGGSGSDACLVVRQPSLIAADKSVLRQLLRVKPGDEDGRSGLLSATGRFARFSGAFSSRKSAQSLVPGGGSRASDAPSTNGASGSGTTLTMAMPIRSASTFSVEGGGSGGGLSHSSSSSSLASLTQAAARGLNPGAYATQHHSVSASVSGTGSGVASATPGSPSVARSSHHASADASGVGSPLAAGRAHSHSTSGGKGDASAGTGATPAALLNNAILRAHFRSLTLAFLRPFEKYFTLAVQPPSAQSGGPMGGGQPFPGSVHLSSSSIGRGMASPPASNGQGDGSGNGPAASGAGRAHPPLHSQSRSGSLSSLFGGSGSGASSSASGGSSGSSKGGAAAAGSSAAIAGGRGAVGGGAYGPYDDLVASFLPRFDVGAFLVELEAAGGPKHRVLAQGQWRVLYERFCASPHFYPWFHARRREAARSLFEMSRSLRMSMSVTELLAPARLRNVFAPPGALAAIEAAAAARAAALREPPPSVAVEIEPASTGPLSPQPSDTDRGAGEEDGGAMAGPLSPTDTARRNAVNSIADALRAGPRRNSDASPELLPSDTGTVMFIMTGSNGFPTSGTSSLPASGRDGSAFSPVASSAFSATGTSTASISAGAPGSASAAKLLAVPSQSAPAASVAPVPNPGPLTRVVGRGMPHTMAISSGLLTGWLPGAQGAAAAAPGSSSLAGAAPPQQPTPSLVPSLSLPLSLMGSLMSNLTSLATPLHSSRSTQPQPQAAVQAQAGTVGAPTTASTTTAPSPPPQHVLLSSGDSSASTSGAATPRRDVTAPREAPRSGSSSSSSFSSASLVQLEFDGVSDFVDSPAGDLDYGFYMSVGRIGGLGRPGAASVPRVMNGIRPPANSPAQMGLVRSAGASPVVPHTHASASQPQPFALPRSSAPSPVLPLPSFTRDDLAAHEAACVGLHAKIIAAFSRDAAFLTEDEELVTVMRSHLAAVKAVMPQHLLRNLGRRGEHAL